MKIIQLTRCILREKTYRTPILKLMFNVFILSPLHFHNQLVQGIVIVTPYIQRIPAHTTFDFTSDTHQLCLLFELFFLVLIFFLQQFILLLQIKNRGRYCRIFFHTHILIYTKIQVSILIANFVRKQIEYNHEKGS